MQNSETHSFCRDCLQGDY